ncbi:MAG: hypothetical protein COA57_03770 [Flavobacteriales bacterium]|nr:MAG: hypothetical protein COA57_03770 [Flavobacteriales bacterium]
MRKTFFLLLFIVSFGTLYSQSIYDKKYKDTLQMHIAELNKLLKGLCVLEFKKRMLEANYFHKNGTMYRTDRMYVETLDSKSVGHSKEEKVVNVVCRNNMEGKMSSFNHACIERTFHEKELQKVYPRTNFDVGTNKAHIEAFEKTIIALIKMGESKNEH